MNAVKRNKRLFISSKIGEILICEVERLVKRVIIVGQGVTLRPLRQSDSRRIFELVKDPKILQNILLPSSYRLEDANDFIKRSNTKWKKGILTFGIKVNDEEKLAGIIGMECNIQQGRAELGYWLGKEYWGRGIMREALSLILNYDFKELGLAKVLALVFPANTSSINCLKKAGFKLEETLRKHVQREGEFFDVFSFGILRDEWMELQATGMSSTKNSARKGI